MFYVVGVKGLGVGPVGPAFLLLLQDLGLAVGGDVALVVLLVEGGLVELASGLVVVGFVEGVDLRLGGHLLVEGQVVGGGQLPALELTRKGGTSSRARPWPNSTSLFSPLWWGYTNLLYSTSSNFWISGLTTELVP